MSGGTERANEPAWLRATVPPTPRMEAAALSTVRRHLSGADAGLVAEMLGLTGTERPVPAPVYPLCRGGCGRPLRKRNEPAAENPGTVRERGGGMCEPCRKANTRRRNSEDSVCG